MISYYLLELTNNSLLNIVKSGGALPLTLQSGGEIISSASTDSSLLGTLGH